MLDPRTIGIAKFGQNLDVDAAAADMYASSSDALDVAAIVTVRSLPCRA